MARSARHAACHSAAQKSQNPIRLRQGHLQTAQHRRAHVLPSQGLATHRYPLRSQSQKLHGRYRSRRRRHLVAIMSPDPNNVESMVSPLILRPIMNDIWQLTPWLSDEPGLARLGEYCRFVNLEEMVRACPA